MEQYIKGLLTLGEAPLATADDWGFHPMAGTLRRLREKCIKGAECEQGVQVADEVQKSGFWPLAGPGLGMVTSRLTGADREEMVKRFTKNYPGVVLHSSVLPALGFLQLVKSQCATKSWAWVPWRRILSEDAALDVQPRKTSRKRDYAEVVAEAAGLCGDEWDLDLLGAPHKVYQLLCVRAHAYAFCNFGHLQSWMGYVANFVEHYSRRPGPGFRPVTPQEAEEADKAMCNEVFRLVFHEDGDIDSALSTVVREDILRLKLMPQPKPAKLPAPPPVSKMPKKMLPDKLRLEPNGKKYKKGICWDFQDGKCSRGDQCRFAHTLVEKS